MAMIENYVSDIEKVARSMIGNDSLFDDLMQEMMLGALGAINEGKHNRSYIINRAKRKGLTFLLKQRKWDRRFIGRPWIATS